jgi:uncharacterized membrane protein YeaQ/YmgE (transglycosylase-associated protein family)
MVEVILGVLFFVIGTALYALDQKMVIQFNLKKGMIVNREKRLQSAAIIGVIGAFILWYLLSALLGVKTESLSELVYLVIGWVTLTAGLWFGPKSVPYFVKVREGKADVLKDISVTVKEQGTKLATEVATAKAEEKAIEKVVEKVVEVPAPPVVHETIEVKTEVVVEKKEEPKKAKTFEETLKDFEKS